MGGVFYLQLAEPSTTWVCSVWCLHTTYHIHTQQHHATRLPPLMPCTLTRSCRAPDTAKVRAKMVYAGSKEAIKRALVGVGIHLNATDRCVRCTLPCLLLGFGLEKVSRGWHVSFVLLLLALLLLLLLRCLFFIFPTPIRHRYSYTPTPTTQTTNSHRSELEFEQILPSVKRFT